MAQALSRTLAQYVSSHGRIKSHNSSMCCCTTVTGKHGMSGMSEAMVWKANLLCLIGLHAAGEGCNISRPKPSGLCSPPPERLGHAHASGHGIGVVHNWMDNCFAFQVLKVK